MSDTKLPSLTQKPLHGVDCTPDKGYPLRILKAYRHNSCCNWETQGLDEADARIYEMMNQNNAERYEILTKAIDILQGY